MRTITYEDCIKIKSELNTMSNYKLATKFKITRNQLQNIIIGNFDVFGLMNENTTVLRRISESELRDLFVKCSSYSDIIRTCNLDVRVSYIKTLKILSKQYNINTSHFVGQATSVGRAPIMKNEEIFKIGYSSAKVVKSRILKGRLIPYKCSECPNEGLHNGKPLVLQLDHINGNNTDNRLENLRFLCPNCHSQTDNFTGKNIRKKENHCIECGRVIKKKSVRCSECIKSHNISHICQN